MKTSRPARPAILLTAMKTSFRPVRLLLALCSLAAFATPGARAAGEIEIISASFTAGSHVDDVTARVNELIQPGAEPFSVDTATLKATKVTVSNKHLVITYRYRGEVKTYTTQNQKTVSYQMLVDNATKPAPDAPAPRAVASADPAPQGHLAAAQRAVGLAFDALRNASTDNKGGFVEKARTDLGQAKTTAAECVALAQGQSDFGPPTGSPSPEIDAIRVRISDFNTRRHGSAPNLRSSLNFLQTALSELKQTPEGDTSGTRAHLIADLGQAVSDLIAGIDYVNGPLNTARVLSIAAAGAGVQILTTEQMAGIVLIEGDKGVATGFLTTFQGSVCVVTNLHVLGENKDLTIKTLQGEVLRVQEMTGAIGADIALLRVASPAQPPPFVLAENVLQAAKIGDRIVVVGNRLGGGVATQTSGKVLGVGPARVEVDAPFQHGNSGSPIFDLTSKQVLGVAAYADSMEVELLGNAASGLKRETHWYGYRLDTVSKWEAIDWNKWRSQAKRVNDFRNASQALLAVIGGQLEEAEVGDPHLRSIMAAVVTGRAGGTAGTAGLTAAQARDLIRSIRAYALEGAQDFANDDYYDYFRSGLYWESSVPQQAKFRAELLKSLAEIDGNIPSYLAQLQR